MRKIVIDYVRKMESPRTSQIFIGIDSSVKTACVRSEDNRTKLFLYRFGMNIVVYKPLIGILHLVL